MSRRTLLLALGALLAALFLRSWLSPDPTSDALARAERLARLCAADDAALARGLRAELAPSVSMRLGNGPLEELPWERVVERAVTLRRSFGPRVVELHAVTAQLDGDVVLVRAESLASDAQHADLHAEERALELRFDRSTGQLRGVVLEDARKHLPEARP